MLPDLNLIPLHILYTSIVSGSSVTLMRLQKNQIPTTGVLQKRAMYPSLRLEKRLYKSYRFDGEMIVICKVQILIVSDLYIHIFQRPSLYRFVCARAAFS